jgi:hypothetical protein
MTRIPLSYGRVALGFSAAWVICTGCNGSTTRRDTGAVTDTSVAPPKTPTSAPQAGACPKDTLPIKAADLKACVANLQFDTDTLSGDEQPLTVIGTPTGLPCPGDPGRKCRYGPMARIEPLKGALNYSEEDLREGRIIARISVPRSEREGYKKYGLQPGRVTYWWVQTDATRTGGRSVFFTEHADGKVVRVIRPLRRYFYEKGDEPTRALARWIWALDDEVAKGTCGAGGCK